VIAVKAVIGQVDDEANLGEPFGQVLPVFFSSSTIKIFTAGSFTRVLCGYSILEGASG
jgi:hypothetical protein